MWRRKAALDPVVTGSLRTQLHYGSPRLESARLLSMDMRGSIDDKSERPADRRC